jgi:hypothetical protein
MTRTLEDLWAIEDIRQLKARYHRFGETKQWDKWADCLTEDFVSVFEGMPRHTPDQPTIARFEGRKHIAELMAKFLTPAIITIHQTVLSEITITSETTADGIWALHDHIRMPTCIFKGWGHYYEDYRKDGGVWRIRNLHVKRLHVEEEWL